ncbi:hypothetical protein RB597_007782 [Gaeumannomyces tritici]
MANPNETPGLCPDWALISSNVHVARDRAWFSTYTPFPTILEGGLEVVGIGDVHLPVKLFPKRSGPEAHGMLHLRDVLHAPTIICNIVGDGFTGDHDMTSRSRDETVITAHDGRRLGCFLGPSPLVLQLSGPPIGPVVGPSTLEPGVAYMLSVFWPDSERQRWAAAQTGRLGSGSDKNLAYSLSVFCPIHLGSGSDTNQEGTDFGKGKDKAEDAPSAPYTAEEKAWLKREWGSEFKLLRTYGLSIYKDEDREEGKVIARAMMEYDEEIGRL